MIKISQLQVTRADRMICSVKKLDVASGDHLAILGSNGSGKTTLLRVLAGLEKKYEGSCSVEGNLKERTYLHQQPYLFRGTVLTNVRYGEPNRAGQGGAAATWLERLGIKHLAGRTPQKLSGGELRRVALARALATRPKLLLLDEPLADLDPEAAQLVCQVLNSLGETTIVVATPRPLPESLSTNSMNLDAITG